MARGNKAKRDAFVSIPAEVKEMLRHLHPAIQHMPKPERMDGVGAEMRHAAYAILREYHIAYHCKDARIEHIQQMVGWYGHLQAAFEVSCLLMGANLADLVVAKHPTGGIWTYRRAKTSGRRADGAEMRVDVPPEVQPFAKRLGSSGRGWWLPRLRNAGKGSVAARVNYNLARWAEANKIQPFTFYAARHSWASIGRSIGIEKATIDDGLCHVGDYTVADIYAEKAWPVINAANRKIIDHVLQK